MPAGRKGGKSSTSGHGKAGGNKQKAAACSSKAAPSSVLNLEEDGCTNQENDVEVLDDAKLSDLSADEPDSSECE